MTKVAQIDAVSLAPQVRQQLKAKQRAALTKLFGQTDQRVVYATAEDLTGPEAFELLLEVGEQVKEVRGISMQCMVWAKALLVVHATFLVSSAKLRTQLEPLYQHLAERVRLQQTLLALHARLAPIADQSAAASHAAERRRKRADDEVDDIQVPLVRYQEGDELLEVDDDKSESDDAMDASAGSDDGMAEFDALDSDLEGLEEFL